jgi:hypothetical protein
MHTSQNNVILISFSTFKKMYWPFASFINASFHYIQLHTEHANFSTISPSHIMLCW